MFSVQAGALEPSASATAKRYEYQLWGNRRSHLVLDEGHQGGDNHCDALSNDSRQLVAQALAACNGGAQHI